ncbi:MAG: hypothetical protein WCD20_01310 [Rhodomicrobium sp.]
MTDGENCPGGVVECDYSEMHELPLVGKVMRTIEKYNQEVNAEPCPSCLRDAMLAVAALLHLEATRLSGANSLLGRGALEEEFGDAARERFHAVTQVAGGILGFRQ